MHTTIDALMSRSDGHIRNSEQMPKAQISSAMRRLPENVLHSTTNPFRAGTAPIAMGSQNILDRAELREPEPWRARPRADQSDRRRIL